MEHISRALPDIAETSRPGRKPTYCPALAHSLIEHLESGGTLKQWCAEHNIARSTVNRWLDRNDNDFAPRFRKARELQTLAWADQMIDEADNAESATERVARLRNDTRWRLMARQAPELWGERKTIDHTSSDGSHDSEDTRKLTRAILHILESAQVSPAEAVASPRLEQARLADIIEHTTSTNGHTGDKTE